MTDKTKKILNIALKVVTWCLVVFSVLMMLFTVITVTTVDRNDRNLLGLRFYIVQSDSMSKSDKNEDLDIHFSAGDIIFSYDVKDKTGLEEGDVISFISSNTDSYGETVTHMIREVKKNDEGEVIGYVTFGTNTGVNDESLVDPSFVLGKYVGRLPGAGYFFDYVKTTPGYIICVLLPFLLLILYNAINVVRLFKKYTKEQRAELDNEKAAVEEERKRNAEMLKELQALKEQLSSGAAKEQGGEASPKEPSDIADTD